mgnify:CR=1 FL=1
MRVSQGKSLSSDSNQRIDSAAGTRIAGFTGGSVSLHDDASADGPHDSDLDFGDGRRAAINGWAAVTNSQIEGEDTDGIR